MLEPEDTKKDIYNSLSRISGLMSLDVMYIDKAEELARKEHNVDLWSSREQLLRENANATMMTSAEDKGTLVTVPVVIKGDEMLNYVMRMG